MKKIIWGIILLFLSQNIVYSQNNLSANSAECLNDKITRITGKNECLAIHTFVKNSETKIKNLVIFIHGDQSDNGPVSGMINNAQGTPVPNGTVKVAILRPGYFDKAGNKSTGNDCGRRDCYTDELR